MISSNLKHIQFKPLKFIQKAKLNEKDLKLKRQSEKIIKLDFAYAM